MPEELERSVCFDRAAEYYDQTRALPTTGRDRVRELLICELSGGGLCLDIGVGTGRTAGSRSASDLPVSTGSKLSRV
ncbi:MAG TPA: hypothetical protein VIV12_28150 [Streptosporangiaceae bacterium]